MKLIIKIQESATFFHFLDSLSDWDIHTRKSVREYYEKRYPIDKEGKKKLQGYIKIRKKYPWRRLDSDFYPSKTFKEIYRKLKIRLKKEEYSIMKEIIDYFYPNIHKIFLEWKGKLAQRKIQIEKEIKNPLLKKLFEDIAKFYESKNYPKIVYVHLLADPSKHPAGGGANISPEKHITIEPYKLKSNSKKYALQDLATIIHEVFHILESGNGNIKNWNKLKRISKKSKIRLDILGEAIADTIAPFGYLTHKYKIQNKIEPPKFSNIKNIYKYRHANPRAYYRKSRQKLSAMIYPLTKKQFEGNKSLFEGDYLKKCIDKYLDMRKNEREVEMKLTKEKH